ncbi:hypothetical protein [Actinomyces sp. Marseille-P3109]|uniref:hypothetical protein n=1 Tax=Actinomyces sp. Marseille-P3109 TaxID=2083009 RepID=UPI00131F381B|nr:hypothetical protein [Actinomyces sp. Marseille-P3109]
METAARRRCRPCLVDSRLSRIALGVPGEAPSHEWLEPADDARHDALGGTRR